MKTGRYWLWLMARIVVAVVLVGMVWWTVRPGQGEKELGQARDALKTARTWKVTQLPFGDPTAYKEGSWEVDCAAGWHSVEHIFNGTDPEHLFDMRTEAGRLGTQSYVRDTDGTWRPVAASAPLGTDPSLVCRAIARGDGYGPFPNWNELIEKAVITNKGKKTVGGVRCREWLTQIPVPPVVAKREITVCLGLRDHLPYEISTLYGSHLVFRQYNEPVQLEFAPPSE